MSQTAFPPEGSLSPAPYRSIPPPINPVAILFQVIRDGLYYAGGLLAAAALIAWLLGWPWCLPVLLLALFVLYFFRNPLRTPPSDPDLVVSPADGKVTAVEALPPGQEFATRISIFLSVFDVHVNRSPVAGRVTQVEYKKGQFLNALKPESAVENEQNLVRLEGERPPVAFIQIAGLIARRIVFWPQPGQNVARGELVGLIKFGSRVDVYLPPQAEVLVRVGQRVAGATSPLARLAVPAVPSSPNRFSSNVSTGATS